MKISEEEQIDEFLSESNAIEREYSDEALEDAKQAWDYAYRKRRRKGRKEITVRYILEIHKLLLQRLEPKIAGKVRDCAVMIGGEIKDMKPEKVLLQELQDWIDDCKPQGKKATEKELKKWHVSFEGLHPFADGNGRTGRILWQVQRLNNGHSIRIIHEGKEQSEYYKWFQ